jgi:hypothetical protein
MDTKIKKLLPVWFHAMCPKFYVFNIDSNNVQENFAAFVLFLPIKDVERRIL